MVHRWTRAAPVAGHWLLVWLLPLTLTACGPSGPKTRVPSTILLFSGDGASPNDVSVLERILSDNHFDYATVSSERLDGMSEADLLASRLLVVPGGNFEQIGTGLAPRTTAQLRNAIGGGLGYLGICAGAFFAGASPYNGLNLTSGVRFPFYGLEDRGIRKAAVAITIAAGPTLDHYWEDGPQLDGWGEVVARYPNGAPAVVQGTFGQGSVILSGIHPEAPESWRRGLAFTTSAHASNAYAVVLIDAAVNRRRLPHY